MFLVAGRKIDGMQGGKGAGAGGGGRIRYLLWRVAQGSGIINTPNEVRAQSGRGHTAYTHTHTRDPARAMCTAQWFRWLGYRIHSCATPLQSQRAPVRVVLSGRWPVPLVGSRLEIRSTALGGSLGAATTTSTNKRRYAVARSGFV